MTDYVTTLQIGEDGDTYDIYDTRLTQDGGVLGFTEDVTEVRVPSLTSSSNINAAATKQYVDAIGTNKQDKLTAGENITITNNVISATGGSGSGIPTITLLESQIIEEGKKWQLTEEQGDIIENNILFYLVDEDGDTVPSLCKRSGTITSNNNITYVLSITGGADGTLDFYESHYEQNTKILYLYTSINYPGDVPEIDVGKTLIATVTENGAKYFELGHDETKQDKLTAGTNITISEDNIISATGSGGGTFPEPTSADAGKILTVNSSGTAVWNKVLQTVSSHKLYYYGS